jgi:hypothetical protein
LPHHVAVPGKAQPGEVLEDGRLEFGPAAAGVDVLDAQQETAAGGAGGVMGEDGGKGVAAMRQAGGRGGEAADERLRRVVQAAVLGRAWRA